MRIRLMVFSVFLLAFININSFHVSTFPYAVTTKAGGIYEAPLLTVRLFELFNPRELHIRAKDKLITIEDLASGQIRNATAARLIAHSKGIRGFLTPSSTGSEQESIIFGEVIKISSPGGLELSPKTQQLPFRSYSGTVRVSRLSVGALLILEEVNLENYAIGVAAAELKNVDAPEAHKALTVLARTFALKNKARHGKDHFDLCDTTHCQLYQGMPAPGSKVVAAARATAGEILFQGAEPAWIYYYSTCGGRTADFSDFPQDPQASGYQSVDDKDFCRSSPHASWQYSLSLDKIKKALVTEGLWPAGDILKNITISQQGSSGRAVRLALQGNSQREIDAWAFRNALCRAYGWSTLKNTFFQMEKKRNNIIFRGRGLGHGLGLCQYGALELSRRGFNYREILQHYYPDFFIGGDKATFIPKGLLIPRGLSPEGNPEGRRQGDKVGVQYIEPLPVLAEAAEKGRGGVAPPLQIAQSEHFILYYSIPGEENQILPGLEEAYKTLKARYGYNPPELVKVTFYASTQDFCRATRQPWWLGAATTAEGMHFQPLAVLQKRGDLSTYLLHEYTHWMVQDISQGRSPHWLTEGLALMESGEGEVLEKEINRRGGVTPPLREIEENLHIVQDKETLRQNYYWAYRFTHCLEGHFGRVKISKFLSLLGQGTKEIDASRQAFGKKLEDLERQQW